MLRYGGGGHVAAGTGQVPHDQAGQVEKELIEALRATG
jgi:nanoRNase/pAp phosphatase (c-di-AMP/oligoRNAs hydrolase)